jgi:G3E family GTPase
VDVTVDQVAVSHGVVPLHIVTGFLGAGKTTVLSELLRKAGGQKIAVLVNEIGELSLDHHLLETVEDGVLALPSGCICCALRGELAESIDKVLALRPDRIVLETTGVADPAPLLHTLAADPRLAATVRIAGVVTVVDAPRLEELLDSQPEVRRQIDLADRLVLTKGDVAPQRVAGARALLQQAAPGREVREAANGAVDPAWLLAETTLDRVADAAQASFWLHHGADGASCRSHSVSLPDAARVDLVELWLRLVVQFDGDRMLRVKALVEDTVSGDVFAVQSAGRSVHPPRRLGQRPAGVSGVQVVLIERGLADEVLQRAFDALRAAVDEAPLVG